MDEHGRLHIEIAPGITATHLPDDFDIDDDVINLAHRASSAEASSRQRSDDIVRQDPTSTADDFYVGTVREIRRSVDPLRHFRVPNSTISLAGLREIGKQAVGRITVHVLFGEDIESYTAWIPTALLEEDVTRGATVEVRLVGTRILAPEPKVVWYCPSIEVIFP